MPTVDIYSKQQVDALIAGAGGLPDPTSASAGDVLTLDSNKDPAWIASSGGDGWEELDLTNLPTNFATTDLIAYSLNCVNDTNSTTPGITTGVKQEGIFLMSLDGTKSVTIGQPVSMRANSTVLSFMWVTEIGNVSNWNGSSQMFRIDYTAIGRSGGHVNITRSNIATYIWRMWRKKTN